MQLLSLRYWRYVVMSMACVMLAACVTPDRIAGSGLDGTKAFSRVGRFALTVTEAGGKQDATQGGFSWLDEGSRFVLDLTNPLGSTEARVQGTPGHATLTRANGTQLTASDPDALAEEALGSRVPVAGLRDWFQGRLSRSSPAESVTRDEQGRVLTFTQGGWRVVLSRYDAQGPQLLVLERLEPGRRIVLRLVANPS